MTTPFSVVFSATSASASARSRFAASLRRPRRVIRARRPTPSPPTPSPPTPSPLRSSTACSRSRRAPPRTSSASSTATARRSTPSTSPPRSARSTGACVRVAANGTGVDGTRRVRYAKIAASTPSRSALRWTPTPEPPLSRDSRFTTSTRSNPATSPASSAPSPTSTPTFACSSPTPRQRRAGCSRRAQPREHLVALPSTRVGALDLGERIRRATLRLHPRRARETPKGASPRV